MTKAYSYARFSTPEQMNGDSLRRQKNLVDDWLALHPEADLDEHLTLRDLGVSAFHAKNAREGALGTFLKAIDHEPPLVEPGSYLLVENLDRVSRADPWDALPIFQQIINAGVTIVTLQDGRVWSREEIRANPFKIFESLMIMIRAHEESAVKARRIRAAWDGKRAKAADAPMTSRGPAWLRLVEGKWQVIEERAAIVRRIFQQTVDGVGSNAIAEQLNREGVPVFGDADGKRKGRHWHRSYVAKILNSSTVIGTLVPHLVDYVDGRKVRTAQEPIEGYYPAVVDKALFEQVQSLTATRSPLRGRHAAGEVQNLLGGLARCPECGNSMTRVNKGRKGGAPKLVCSAAKIGAGCDYRTVDYPQVERAIVANLGAGFAGELGVGAEAPASDKVLRDQIAELDAKIAEHEGRLNNLLSAIENLAAVGDTSPTLARRLRETEQELLELTDQRKELERQATAEIGPKQRLEALHKCLAREPLDLTAANSLLRQCAKAVVVDYDRKELVLRWQFGGESRLRYDMFPAGRFKLPIIRDTAGRFSRRG